MNKHTLLLAALGLIQGLSAHAAGDERLDHYLSMDLVQLMALEVTISTHTKQPISKAPSVVTVITAEDIAATGATNLVDVLEGVPGIHVRWDRFGFRPLVHFRGASASHTLLMVNGAPMKDLQWGFGIFWKGLPASMIERVEIIRGPGSALFGSDASAGVINVITKTAGRIEGTGVGARSGSFDSQAGWLQHGGNWNGVDVGLTAEVSGTDGHDPFIAADAGAASGSTGNGWRNQDLRFGLAKGHWRLHADYTRHDDLETGLTGGGVLDPVTRASDSGFNLDLLYNNPRFAPDWGLDAELRYRHIDSSSGAGFQERPPGYTDGTYTYGSGQINRQRAAEHRVNGEVSGLFTGLPGHAVRLGAGYVWEYLYRVEHWANYGTGPDGSPLNGTVLADLSDTPYAFAPEKARRIGYLFLQDVWTLSDDWELTAGARYDHYSDFGSTLNPRLALVWQATDRLTTKLMYGQAFRAPSYQELYSPTANARPNPDLEPERSRTWDLSFSYAAAKDLRLGLGLFRLDQSDLIAATGTPLQYQNTGDHSIRGVELEAQWQAAPTLRISGNYSHRDQARTSQSVYVPDDEAYLRADWAFRPRWNWDFQANWIGPRPRPAGDTRATLDAYTLVDTTLRYAPGNDWEFAVSIRNLFDADAREYTSRSIPGDLPLPGRNFFAELRYKF